MDQVLDIDFSEIVNEEDDSVAFVDFNILESARQELEKEKEKECAVERRHTKHALEPIEERNDEHMVHKPKTYTEMKVDTTKFKPAINSEARKCNHSSIQPVFDCLYWAKNNVVVNKLIHKNLVNKYKDSDIGTTTLPYYLHSTAVSALHARSASVQKENAPWKFYSLSNSVAKIRLEKQSTFDGKRRKNWIK